VNGLIERTRLVAKILRDIDGQSAMAATVDEAAAALEAAREDASRWRWLRREVFHGDIPVGEARLILEVTGSCPSRAELDAAIDQARGKEVLREAE